MTATYISKAVQRAGTLQMMIKNPEHKQVIGASALIDNRPGHGAIKPDILTDYQLSLIR